MSRLIDIDQQIVVPVVDESRGGVEYEMQMTVAEFFDKFLDGFKPEVVDAVPVEWLKQIQHGCAADVIQVPMYVAIGWLIDMWQQEQGGGHDDESH